MSGFFDKTREDMQYIFKKGSTLSQSEKKHKLRAWATVIGIALVVVQLVFTVLTLLKLYKLDILPLKYIAAIDAVLVLVAIYDFLSQFTKTHIIGKVISILLSAVLLYTFLFTSKVDTTLDKISSNGNNVQEITDVVDVVVLKKDKAQSLSDTLSYTFGYNSTVDADDNQDAIQKINFNNNADIKTREYTTWEDIIPALEAGTDIQAMLINDNTLSSFDEEYEEFLNSIRIVGTIELKRTVELSESDKKVNEEPFVIYISGNDEEGKILSTGRSDVNILCVIHPITRQVLLITTPRDAYINLTNPGTGAQGYDKLTHAGQWGIEGSILNLQNLYDLNIDYYVKINFTGCETIVDALGGVTINSSVDFVNGLEAAPTRYHYVIGDNECNGEQTLAFCRERNAFLDGDYQRGRNQLAALTAIINKLQEQKTQVPLVIMTYINPVYQYGIEAFVKDLAETSVKGLIIPDLPDEHANFITPYLKDSDIALVPLVSLTTGIDRQKQLIDGAEGFIYAVAINGVTGKTGNYRDDLDKHLANLTAHADIPVLTGFGVSTEEDIKRFNAVSDGVIVGSKIVRDLHDCKEEDVAEFVTFGSHFEK